MDHTDLRSPLTLIEPLTDRELEILRLLADDLSIPAMAERLVLSPTTVKWYTQQIYGKLDIQEPGQKRRLAVARGRALGLLEANRTPAGRPHYSLPVQATAFVGRTRERAEIAALLANPTVRLVTLLGPGGMGKTRLALEVGWRLVEPAAFGLPHTLFTDGVYFVPLQPVESPDNLAWAVAEAVAYPFQSDKRSPQQQLLDFFREKRLLLIMDNFEHLLEGASLVSAILETAPGVQILITSRETLNLTAENVYDLKGLPFPGEVDEALDYDAARLFVQGALRARAAFALTPDDLPALARICALVEGMPLAILLAAAWVEVLSLPEIAEEIAHCFDFLTAEMRDAPQRQWSIRAVFEPTWNRLSYAERDAFMRFSVFRGGCTREAAQAVTGADLRTLQALINKALLDRDSTGRYTMHELLRQYAEQQLNAAGLTEETNDAHCDYFLNFLREREHDIKGQQHEAAFRAIEVDFENVRMAWQWAVENRAEDVLHQAAVSLGLFADFGRRGGEVGTLFRLAHDRFRQPGEALAPGWVQLLVCHRGDETLPAPFTVEQAEKSLAAAYQHHDVFLAGCALCLLRHDLSQNLDMPGVCTVHEDSLHHWQAQGETFDLGWSLVDTATYFASLGQNDRTIDLLQRAVSLFRIVENKLMLGISLHNLANRIANATGDFAESKRWLHEVLTFSTKADIFAHSSLGLKYFYTGDFEEARALFETAQAIAADTNHLRAKSWSLDYYAMLACVEGDYRSAQQLVEQSASLRKIRTFDRPVHFTWVSASVACGLADYQAARRHLHTFFKMQFEARTFALMATGLSVGALIRGHTGDRQGAAELLGLAFTHPMSATGWMERWDLLTQFRADLEADLGSEAFQAAWERGAALDLETVIAELLEEFAE